MNRSKTCCQRIRENFLKILLFSILLAFIFQYFLSNTVVKNSYWATVLASRFYISAPDQWSKNVQDSLNRLLSKLNDNHILDANTSMPMLMTSVIIANTTENSSLSVTGSSILSAITVTTVTATATKTVLTTAVTTTSVLCPLIPPNLVGPISIYEDSPSFSELDSKFGTTNILPGGHWRPSDCSARHRVAIVIPYRNREPQLRTFLNNMHPFLQKQQLDYSIIVVEQDSKSQFNRAMLMNIGFVEAKKLYDSQCFIFHDVDLLPEDDRNLYSCPVQPRHMSAAVSTLGYRLPYADIFGGVSALSREQFEKVNGFSNKFFGWGGEDDDMAARVKHYGFSITRYPMDIARYKMLSHKKDAPSPDRFKYLYSGKQRFSTDGLNSLTYKLLKVNQLKLYTLVQVEINEEQVLKS